MTNEEHTRRLAISHAKGRKRDAARRLQPGFVLARRCRRYRLSSEAYVALEQAQEGRCAICEMSPAKGLHIDHDHESGRVRGLLCNECNGALGFLGDSSRRAHAAAVYLERHGK